MLFRPCAAEEHCRFVRLEHKRKRAPETRRRAAPFLFFNSTQQMVFLGAKAKAVAAFCGGICGICILHKKGAMQSKRRIWLYAACTPENHVRWKEKSGERRFWNAQQILRHTQPPGAEKGTGILACFLFCAAPDICPAEKQKNRKYDYFLNFVYLFFAGWLYRKDCVFGSKRIKMAYL